jgi:hypothetical protein
MMVRVPNGKYPRKRRLGTEQRQALDLLAGDPHGATEELLVLAMDSTAT